MLDAQRPIDALAHRRNALDREIVALLPTSPSPGQVALLRCLRGVDTPTAAGLCAEIADFERFAKAEQLMSYVGLVPVGGNDRPKRWLGTITKTGSGHARRAARRKQRATTARDHGSPQPCPELRPGRARRGPLRQRPL
ncbi:MAG TPA: transposase [Solirubrobacteraceae bacterium]|jgi:transposase|nr:transposase [Solirubrobacteraceae bacterium]